MNSSDPDLFLNSTPFDSAQCVYELDFGSTTVSLVLLKLLFVSVIVGGNSLIVVALLTDNKLRASATNHVLISLAVSDGLVGLFVLPFGTAQDWLHNQWPFGQLWCRLWLSFDVWLCSASIFNLLAVSFDRYSALSRPIQYKLYGAQKTSLRLIVLVWIGSLLVTLPGFYIDMTVPSDGQSGGWVECDCHPYTPDWYILYASFSSFFVPLAILIALNLRIVTIAFNLGKFRSSDGSKQTMRVTRGRTDEPTRKKTMHRLGGIVKNSVAQMTSSATEVRVARTVLLVIAAFTVCWTPFFVIYALHAYRWCTVADGCMPLKAAELATWLGYTNSALNPFIYALTSQTYRRAFSRTLRGLCACCPGADRGNALQTQQSVTVTSTTN